MEHQFTSGICHVDWYLPIFHRILLPPFQGLSSPTAANGLIVPENRDSKLL
jgi:hypothetical protein